ncbi:MAG: LppX_LprAFG lipoprotein [Thermomicrobiales bacterium]|nr:LppX_LprAFG lipoprotein [Thermomicrobiales bacterium]
MRLRDSPVLLLLVALLVVGLAGCGSENEVVSTPAATPSPAELLTMASRRLAETQSVHFTLTVEGETYIDSGKTIKLIGAEGDLQRPDRVRTTFQAEVMGRAISLQLITIGDRSWTTNILTGEWGNAPLEFAYRPDILFSTQDGIGPVMGRVQNVTRLDDEEIGGRDAYHLQASVDQSVVGPLTYYTINGSPVSVDLWIDKETHDLLRARLAEPPGPERPHPAVWTLDLSHHGEEISIEPPD